MIERRIAVVFVIDQRGRVLMQHRSADAAVSPNQWTMPGGKIEDGESPIDAARREVYEETGLQVVDLLPIWSGTRASVKSSNGVVEVHAFAAATDAVQEDVVLGEGQAMVFMPPSEALAKDLGVTAALVLAPFLESEAYRTLATRGRNGATRAADNGHGGRAAIPDQPARGTGDGTGTD